MITSISHRSMHRLQKSDAIKIMVHTAPLLTHSKTMFINKEGMDLWLAPVSYSKFNNYFL